MVKQRIGFCIITLVFVKTSIAAVGPARSLTLKGGEIVAMSSAQDLFEQPIVLSDADIKLITQMFSKVRNAYPRALPAKQVLDPAYPHAVDTQTYWASNLLGQMGLTAAFEKQPAALNFFKNLLGGAFTVEYALYDAKPKTRTNLQWSNETLFYFDLVKNLFNRKN